MGYNEAGSIIGRAVLACFSWFNEFDVSLGGVLTATILGFFTMYTVTRLFLSPLIGQASSDLVSNVKKPAGGQKTPTKKKSSTPKSITDDSYW